MTCENKLKKIYDKLFVLILQLRKICVHKISDIPMQINKIIVGQDKLKPHIGNCFEYEVNQDDLKDATSIKDYQFYRRTNLTGVYMPNSITRIWIYAFAECSNLTHISIPDTVTSIGSNAFYKCLNLTDMYLYPTAPPTLDSKNAIPTTTTIHVPIGSGDAYKTATNWSLLADKIVEDIEI